MAHVGWPLVVNALNLGGAGGERPVETGIQCCCVCLEFCVCVFIQRKINSAI